jgi:hypothetical protein
LVQAEVEGKEFQVLSLGDATKMDSWSLASPLLELFSSLLAALFARAVVGGFLSLVTPGKRGGCGCEEQGSGRKQG